jgi:hypothetical protein
MNATKIETKFISGKSDSHDKTLSYELNDDHRSIELTNNMKNFYCEAEDFQCDEFSPHKLTKKVRLEISDMMHDYEYLLREMHKKARHDISEMQKKLDEKDDKINKIKLILTKENENKNNTKKRKITKNL